MTCFPIPVCLRRTLVCTVILSVCSVLAPTRSSEAGELIRDTQARRHGLVRSWFTQARLDPARNELSRVVLKDDYLYLMTSSGSVQALDANTGKSLWSKQIGNSSYPSQGPAADQKHVAMVNGSKVYVLDRKTGREVLSRRLSTGVAASPALSEQYVFVPQFSGRVDAFNLEQKSPVPWIYISAGRIFENATAGQDSIIWATDQGFLYVADPVTKELRFRFETTLPIDAAPTSHRGQIFVASTGGYVYAVDEQLGRQLWRYSTGFPISEAPIALGKTVIIATHEPALLCLDATNGHLLWSAPGVTQFISASPQRVYGLTEHRGFVVLDREHGAVRSRAPNVGDYRAVLNEQNDRLYLVTSDGLIQCLHETELEEPVPHEPKAAPPEEEDKEEKPAMEDSPSTPVETAAPPADDPFAAGDDPFAAGAAPLEGDPFAPQPGNEAPAGGDPFAPGAEGDPFSEDPFE